MFNQLPRTTLINGVTMPWMGLGVYKAFEGDEVVQSVKTALDVGYRLIDTHRWVPIAQGNQCWVG